MTMKRRKKNSRKSIGKLTVAELEKMSGEFDGEFVVDTFGPRSPDATKRLRRAKRKSGRPRVGAGSKPICVTVEKTLLEKIDRIAKRRKTSRARLIARGLKAVLKEEEASAD